MLKIVQRAKLEERKKERKEIKREKSFITNG
jgi:hypothetical protein